MMDHWEDLQHHILPGILGAIRIANPGRNVKVFWETTGKTQVQRPPNKSQRHFNDFPDIDIVGIPRNKLSPLFIRQSIEHFLSDDIPKKSITRHLFIVAMSNPIDDSSFAAASNTGEKAAHLMAVQSPLSPVDSSEDTKKWDELALKLQENNIILHLIVNPAVRLTRIFEVFRKTMRYQSRQEVIPWQPLDTTHCICHLSGSPSAAKTQGKDQYPEEWPEVHLDGSEPSSPLAVSPTHPGIDGRPIGCPQNGGGSDDERDGFAYPFPPTSPISPIDLINALHPPLSRDKDNIEPGFSGSGNLSLVSRMQALHGLASRRRPNERSRRTSVNRASFFRDTSPAPSPRRERILSSRSTGMDGIGNTNNMSNNMGTDVSMLRSSQSSLGLASMGGPRLSTGQTIHGRRSRGHSISGPSFSSALQVDLRGPIQVSRDPGLLSPTEQGYHPYEITNTSSSLISLHPPSPGSDTSGSGLSNSLSSLPPGPQTLNTGVSPYQAQMIGPPSPTHTSHQPTQYQILRERGGSNSSSISLPLPSPGLYPGSQSHLDNSNQPQPPSLGSGGPGVGPIRQPQALGMANLSMPLTMDNVPSGNMDSIQGLSNSVISRIEDVDEIIEEDDGIDVVPASAPPDARGQVPFVFDAAYEAQSAIRLRQAISCMHRDHEGGSTDSCCAACTSPGGSSILSQEQRPRLYSQSPSASQQQQQSQRPPLSQSHSYTTSLSRVGSQSTIYEEYDTVNGHGGNRQQQVTTFALETPTLTSPSSPGAGSDNWRYSSQFGGLPDSFFTLDRSRISEKPIGVLPTTTSARQYV
ncbi:hypothetical protein PNOK_0932300 [Pyrrhoderma noxium]|uniref:Uncharacterized protein n=1 Tax=Pyrrhoderma noxium TaxID=2282107 RepID=A0A286U5A7_9AGAM|nr:hypothetical protein PNOK_0932300 [Pyrrhoderma noxium]